MVTGKPVDLFGSRGRDEAHGPRRGLGARGDAHATSAPASVSGKRCAIQGFGNVGSWAARFSTSAGPSVVAVSDVKGGVTSPAGLDVGARAGACPPDRERDRVPGTDAVSNADLLILGVDVLIPAALGGVLTKREREGRARALRGGGRPMARPRPRPTRSCDARGIPLLPDIYANAGGVTVSYFEWVQNIQQFTWDEDKVNAELHRHMREAYATIARVAREHRMPLRTAAFILAIGRRGSRHRSPRGV